MPFQSLDTQVANQQLLVQNLVVRYKDANLYSASGSVVAINVNENVGAVYCVLRCKDAGPSVELVAQSNISINNTTFGAETITVTLASNFASNDCLILNYSIAQTAP